MTQKELADAAGIVYVTLSALENDKRRPSPRVARSLARVLGVTAEMLFPALDDPTPPQVLERHIKRRAKRHVVSA